MIRTLSSPTGIRRVSNHLDTRVPLCYQLRVHRDSLKSASRLVVKLGTGVLTDSRKQPDRDQMEQLVAQVAAQRQAGKEVVLVTSGAVGAGMGALGYDRRPAQLAELQACAAVGQSRLMTTYEKLFAGFDLSVGQVLLTHDDLEHHERHLNARNTLVTDSLGNVTTYRCDPIGLVREVVDPLGDATRYRYDAALRLVQIVHADGSSVTDTYDARGNLLQRKGPGAAVWKMRYDDADHCIEAIDCTNPSASPAGSMPQR